MLFLGKRSNESLDEPRDLKVKREKELGRLFRSSNWPGLPEIAPAMHSGLHLSGERHRICGNKECVSSRVLPWRSRRRPIFEGMWACSGNCMLAMVRAAVRREYGQAPPLADESLHHHRIPLGLVLLAQGWITHSQLQRALDSQRASGGRIGDWLVTLCGIGREQITRGLSVQWSCPVLTTAGFGAQEMALVMPKVFVQEFGALPVRTAGARILYLGFDDRLDASLGLALEKMSGLRVVSGLVDSDEIRSSRCSLLAAREVTVKLESLSDMDLLASKIAALVEHSQPMYSQLVRVHHYLWLRLWLESGAASGVGTLPRRADDMVDYLFQFESN